MVLSKLTQVPVMLRQQELAPVICCFSAWGTRPTSAGRLLLAWPVPCWLFAGLEHSTGVLWLLAGDAGLDISLLGRMATERPPL